MAVTKATRKPTATKGNGTKTPVTNSRPVSGRGGTAAAPARTKPVATPVAEVEEDAVDQQFVDEQNDIAEEAEGASGDEILDLTTEELESPSRKADAHRATVMGVEEFHSESSGSPAIRILLHSDDADFDTRWDVYVPRPFEDNINILPHELCKVKNEETGEKNEQLQFALGVRNKQKTAVIDKLRAAARAEGRSLRGYAEPVETFSDYCAALHTLCEGIQCVFLRGPRRDNPQFLEMQDLLPISSVEDPKMQGKFKNRVKAWESQG